MDYFKALIDWRKNSSFFMLFLILIAAVTANYNNLKRERIQQK